MHQFYGHVDESETAEAISSKLIVLGGANPFMATTFMSEIRFNVGRRWAAYPHDLLSRLSHIVADGAIFDLWHEKNEQYGLRYALGLSRKWWFGFLDGSEVVLSLTEAEPKQMASLRETIIWLLGLKEFNVQSEHMSNHKIIPKK